MAGASRRRGTRTTLRRPRLRPVPDLVACRFEADAPARLWVANLTSVRSVAGYLFLAVVVDAFGSRVVGWQVANHLRTELVMEALNMAPWQRRPASVVRHSDQGSQYPSYAFGKRCREMRAAPSMGSAGDCFDNAMTESSFATLECEVIDRCVLRIQAEPRMPVFGRIEGWYNPPRRHSGLGCLSPLNFEGSNQEAAV